MDRKYASLKEWETASELPAAVIEALEKLGVVSLEDLAFVDEECLKQCKDINFIQLRRLRSAISTVVTGHKTSECTDFRTASAASAGTSESRAVAYSVGSSAELEKKASTQQRPPRPLLEQQMKNAKRLKKGTPSIYKLVGTETFHDRETGMRHFKLSTANLLRGSKTVLLLGETGSGKSTLINAIANYALGVDWDDDFRVQLVEDTSKPQSESQTDSITAYTINTRAGFPMTIIDTPGFGDTRGPQRDANLVKMIRKFFESAGKHPVDHIDAICIVMASSQSRLTPVQKYILDSILALFSHNIKENIFVFLTFCDANTPQVLTALRDFQVPYSEYFKFNNSALFYQKSENDDEFNKLFWIMMERSCKKFFDEIQTRTAKSLTLTKMVLQTRWQLESAVNGLEEKVNYGLMLLEIIRKDKRLIEDHESAINANKDFVVKRKVPQVRKVSIAGTGKFVTNCTLCNMTCHYPCQYKDKDKWLCWTVNVPDEFKDCDTVDDFRDGKAIKVVTGLTAEENRRCRENSACGVCPKKCSWKVHKNNDFRFETAEVEETVTLDYLKVRYRAAVQGLSTAEAMKRANHEKYQEAQRGVYQCVKTIRVYIEELERIALRPKALTTVDYIKLMIVQEKSDCRPGYPERIGALEAIVKHANLLNSVKDKDDFNPLGDLYK